MADKTDMSSSINSLSGFLQSILTSSLQSAGSKTSTAATSTTGTASASDSTKLSPLAQLMSSLQQLQQSNPAEYQQVTKQISTNLQNAAQTAQSDGNTTAANQLGTLATDFANASQTGQLPNIQDLAQAVTGSGHHHHHHGGGDQDLGLARLESQRAVQRGFLQSAASGFLKILSAHPVQPEADRLLTQTKSLLATH